MRCFSAETIRNPIFFLPDGSGRKEVAGSICRPGSASGRLGAEGVFLEVNIVGNVVETLVEQRASSTQLRFSIHFSSLRQASNYRARRKNKWGSVVSLVTT
jgi:hypothetical protein